MESSDKRDLGSVVVLAQPAFRRPALVRARFADRTHDPRRPIAHGLRPC